MSEFWLDKALSKQTWTSVASSALALTRSGRLVVLAEPAPAIAAWAEPTANSGTARATTATAARVSHALLSREGFNRSSLGLGFRCPGPLPPCSSTSARRGGSTTGQRMVVSEADDTGEISRPASLPHTPTTERGH